MNNVGKWVSVNGSIELPYESDFVLVKAAFIGEDCCAVKSLGGRYYFVRKGRFRAFTGSRFVVDTTEDTFLTKGRL